MHELQNVAWAPRVLRVDLSRAPSHGAASTGAGPHCLGRAAAELAPWVDDEAGEATAASMGGWSGSALGLELLERAEAQSSDGPALVISVADGVRCALPTAARATIAARSPLTGRYTDGQVGSELARRLARCADALVLCGRTSVRGALLRIVAVGESPEPVIELWSWPELCDQSPARIGAEIERCFGACASLRIGWAGARGIRYASLAAGVDPQSFVGRGGLGAVFGALGLVALVVAAEPVAAPLPRAESEALVQLLARSPRLRARAHGGTFELAEAFAVRGDLRAPDGATAWSAERARSWSAQIARASGPRAGCTGCPTPCGWTFESPAHGAEHGAERRVGRFSAVHALGPALGLASATEALDLLARCDAAGLDAKELGAALAVLCRAHELGRLGDEPAHARGERWWGNADALRARFDELRTGTGIGARLARGAAELARELACNAPAETELEFGVSSAHGDALRPEASLAVLLGQCVSARGADPMRTSPFLLDTSRETMVRVVAPLELPAGAEDPLSPVGKGRIVWWHENWMAALDLAGFCAFSASALLSDGIVALDELAAAIEPRGLRADPRFAGAGSGERLLAAGATLVHRQRAYNERHGPRSHDVPEPLRAQLCVDGLWPEYARLRGLDAHAALTARAHDAAGTLSLLRLADGDVTAARSPAPANAGGRSRSLGRVRVRCLGPLASSLGDALALDVLLPDTLGELLLALALRYPHAARQLVNPHGEILPAVYRGGRKLATDDAVAAGDEIDLVVALRGG
ncbi:MAG: aldehyde ferredoxin oxidoreductase C-terminal domain-containing protein [Planctomycetota bacterium]